MLLEVGENGKLVSDIKKVSTTNYHDLEEFIVDSEKSGLRYMVVDEDNDLFADLRTNPTKYTYLIKIFDSDEVGYKNHFMIYEIDYKLFDNNDK